MSIIRYLYSGHHVAGFGKVKKMFGLSLEIKYMFNQTIFTICL